MNALNNRVLGAIMALVLVGAHPAATNAQTAGPFDPVAFEASIATAQDDAERLAFADQAIATVNAVSEPDVRMFFDLNEMRLDLLLDLDETATAAELCAGLANFVLANRDIINRDPIFFAKLSAQLYEAAGDLRLAQRLLDFEAELRLDAGQTGAPLARVYRDMQRIAAARGNETAVQKFSDMEKAALAPDDGATRNVGDVGFSKVEVFYATDRARTGSTDPNAFYGYGRGDLEYGVVTVSIPAGHKAGAIELPSVWRLEFGPKPTKHVMLRTVEPMAFDAYFAKMRLETAKKPRKEAFVFVHGFNVPFDAAARRAAQLTYDMNYTGVPILYSWPSAGKKFNYVADTAVVRLSGRRLSHFLEDLHEKSGADTIHIIGHSMGNRALTDALELLALRTEAARRDTPMFGQLFFAAPDVDAGLFREMLTTIKPLAERMTLYSSANDWALEASKKLHGGAPRAGQAGDTILTDSMFDTVDMSNLGEDMLAHSYFANDSSALVDIVSLLWRNPAPENRCGIDKAPISNGLVAWQYTKGACSDRKLVGLISHLWTANEISPEKIRRVVQSLIDDPEEADRLEAALISLSGVE